MELPVLQRLNTRLRTQRISRAYGIEALCSLLETYLPPDQVAMVRRAYEFGARMHEGQYRKSGEPYIYHPLAVARILAEMRLDHVTLMGAILHDVIEDTPAAKDEVASEFGTDVAELVDGVSKLEKAQFRTRAELQAESFRKLLLAMTRDVRVILVKLADRLHNMRTLGSVSNEQRRRVARETLEIYAPIAHRLGINTIRVELEDRGFAAMHPNRYRVLKKAIKQVTGNRRNLVREIEERLSRTLRDEGIGASVMGRQKNLYSIYRKMRLKHRRFLDVLDLYGFRVIVDDVDDCYRTLGIVHHVYRPISERFNDFIANPKVNGYQSLHTTLLGPGGVRIEVQIRTRDMHHIAESGIAAHWLYKLGNDSAKAPEVRAREWLSQLAEIERGAGNSLEFIESVKVDLYPDEVYVFTPKGDIRGLPRGATPVDFAYAVHTDLGNHCLAARIDGHLAALNTPLANGQMVEVITARYAHPNAAWLNFVKTGKARAAVRHHLKTLHQDEAGRLGHRLLDKSLEELGINLRKLGDARVRSVLRELDEESLDALYVDIGLGQRLAPLVARHFLPEDGSAENRAGQPQRPLAVEGTEGLVVEYARCCHPIPGDAIRGRVSMGRGIVIHRQGCAQAQTGKDSPHGWVDLCWSDRVQGDFPVELRIQARNGRGTLAQLATRISDAGSNIENVQMSERDGAVINIHFVISVSDRLHLARVIRSLRRITVVERVART